MMDVAIGQWQMHVASAMISNPFSVGAIAREFAQPPSARDDGCTKAKIVYCVETALRASVDLLTTHRESTFFKDASACRIRSMPPARRL
jgi:hypothetical protein